MGSLHLHYTHSKTLKMHKSYKCWVWAHFLLGPLLTFLSLLVLKDCFLGFFFLFLCCRFIYVIILYGYFSYISVCVPCACTASIGQKRTLDLKLKLKNVVSLHMGAGNQIPVIRKSRPPSHLSRPQNNGSFVKWIVKSFWIILYGWVSVLGGHNVRFLCCCCFVFCVFEGQGKYHVLRSLFFYHMSGYSKYPFTSCLVNYIFLFFIKINHCVYIWGI